jgi:hypothetical protein
MSKANEIAMSLGFYYRVNFGSDLERYYLTIRERALEDAAELCTASDRYRGDYFAAKIMELIDKE